MLADMRPLILLGALVAVFAGFIMWKTFTPPPEPAPAPPDASTGVLIVGLPPEAGTNLAIADSSPPAMDGASEVASTLTENQSPLNAANPSTPEPSEASFADTETARVNPATVVELPTPLIVKYEVQQDDTLYRILRFAYDKANQELVDAVASANKMDDPSELMVGQVLILPLVNGYQSPRGNF